MKFSPFVAIGIVLAASACSSSSNSNAAAADSGTPDTAVDATNDGASDTSADAGVVRTSASCGGIPVLGAQGTQNTPACATCVDSSCCAQASACAANAECVAFRECVAACADAACKSACQTAHPDGIQASDAFAACRTSSCSQDCANLACVGNVTWAAPSASTIDMTYVVQSFKDGTVVAGAQVKACPKSDAACATPIARGTTDATGQVTMTLPTSPEGVDAYLEITATGYANMLSFASYADNRQTYSSKKLYLLAIDQSTLDAFAGIAGATSDPTRGNVAFLALDCTNGALGGVSVSASTADASSKTAYVAGSLPSATATATDGSGVGAIFGVPAGAITIAGKLAPSGTRLGSVSATVRAGWVTTVNVVPTP